MADDVHALTGVYALSALPEAEHVEFERHLEVCPSCRREVRSFHAVTADLASLVEEPPPPSLRAKVMAATAVDDDAEVVQWATRALLGVKTRQEVVDVALAVVERLGGWVVPADLADDRALPVDVGFGSGAPLLPAADPGSAARQALQRHLPQFVEDARQALETVHRTDRTDRGAGHEVGRERDGRQR